VESITHAQPGDRPAGRGKRAALWGAGGTALSAAAFVGLALFEQYNGVVNELRADLKHFNEASAQLATKDELRRLRDQVKEVSREAGVQAADRARLERELVASEQARADQAREVQRLRERVAYVEGQHAGRANSIGAPGAGEP
jgi:hypothetical protein